MLEPNATHPCDDCQKPIMLSQAHPTCTCGGHSQHAEAPGIAHKAIYVCSGCALERGIPVNSHAYLWP